MSTYSIPVLYILMRNDLASMNPGKAMAQASHASNAFVKDATVRLNGDITHSKDINLNNAFETWKGETGQGFGTVIVLAVNENEMRTATMYADACGFVNGIVHDPTYPLLDGDSVHFIPLDTCAYVFGIKDDPMLKGLLRNFPLHP